MVETSMSSPAAKSVITSRVRGGSVDLCHGIEIEIVEAEAAGHGVLADAADQDVVAGIAVEPVIAGMPMIVLLPVLP
jgi:hypothetical protein